MKIDWKSRAKNPVFWAQCIAAVVCTIVVGAGLTWEDMTSWQKLAETMVDGLGNPVVFVSMVVALWTAVTDPSTPGAFDGDKVQQ